MDFIKISENVKMAVADLESFAHGSSNQLQNGSQVLFVGPSKTATLKQTNFPSGFYLSNYICGLSVLLLLECIEEADICSRVKHRTQPSTQPADLN